MKTGRIVGVIVVLGGLAGLGVVFAERVSEAVAARKAAAAPVPVEKPRVYVEPLARRDLAATVRFTGTIRARNRVDVFPEISGRIQEVLFDVGDRVEAKQVLAVIEHRSLELHKSQAKAQTSAAAATAAQAKVGLDTAQRELARVKQLAGQGAASTAELDQAQTNVDNAQAALRAAKSQHSSAQVAVGLTNETLGDSRVASPIGGIVTKRAVEVGTQVGPTQATFEVQDIDALELDGSVTAADYARIQVGREVEIRVDAHPGVTFTGTVATMSPSLDPATRRAAIEVRIDNKDHRLLPNMFATASLSVDRQADVLALPRVAIVTSAEGPSVFVVVDGAIVRVPLTLGVGNDEFVEVQGPKEGDAIVVAGHEALADGVQVEVVDGGERS